MNNEKRPILICNDGFRQYPIVPECTEFARRHQDGTEETIGFFLPKEDLDEYVGEVEKLIDELYDKIAELKKGNGDNPNFKPLEFEGFKNKHEIKEDVKKTIIDEFLGGKAEK